MPTARKTRKSDNEFLPLFSVGENLRTICFLSLEREDWQEAAALAQQAAAVV